MIVARRYIVRGLVQGVGFRWFVLRRARERGVGGWVQNRPDGTVEVLAEGEPTALEGLEGDLRSGPRSARVSDFSVTEERPTGAGDQFNIH
jgi:acylphosphatase